MSAETFESLVAQETTRLMTEQHHDNRSPVYAPDADPVMVETHRELSRKAGSEWGLGAVASVALWVPVVAALDTMTLIVDDAAAATGFAGWLTTCVAAFVAECRASSRYKRFKADHPEITFEIPDRAFVARREFLAAAEALATMDLPDDVRAQVADATTAMDRLVTVIGALDEGDVHTRERLVAEVVRVAAETLALLTLARRRADLVKGLDADEIIATAGRPSLSRAAADIADEDAHVSGVLARAGGTR